jgi:putative two-component system hydrogenase maturation factor HypX/HoxX
MRVLLLCSAFNGLSQRAWIELRESGHQVTVQISEGDESIRAAVAATDPDLVICPFLRERVPEDVWRSRPTIVVHPGPPGDRGPSSLDWAILDAEPAWGVTALQAVDEMDAGPVWATQSIAMPADPLRKSDLYNGLVADAAIAVIREVLSKALDPGFRPQQQDYHRPDVWGRARPGVRQFDRHFRWADETEHILRRIRASDGSPGAHTVLSGVPVAVFDAHRGTVSPGEAGPPGTLVRRRHGAVLVRTGDAAVWIGHLRALDDPRVAGLKLPATTVLTGHLSDVPKDTEGTEGTEGTDDTSYREIGYRRDGDVGAVRFRFYNGAMSTAQSRRLEAALRYAVAQDTKVLLLGGGQPFSNGIHLGVIEGAADPAREAWDNIVAIDDVCRRIITCTGQLIVAAVGGSAGAGGVMLALGADRVLQRDGTVLNPHYQNMGLYGSEYWTYVLPGRVGRKAALSLTSECLPIGAREAGRIGLADVTLTGTVHHFEMAAARYAAELAVAPDYADQLARKQERRDVDEQRRPLAQYRRTELAEMRLDIVEDRRGFADARRAFIRKQVQRRPAA